MPEVENNLGRLRQKHGLSAIQLASIVDVSRQTIYAMESGSYVPNTVVALKLARALGTTVEDIFALPSERSEREIRSEAAELIPGGDSPQPGQPVQLCRVDDRLMANVPSPIPWFLPAADAVVGDKKIVRKRAEVQIFQSEMNLGNRILLAGCDPGISVLARHVLGSGVELVLVQRNSSQAVSLLNQGAIHIAGTHLKVGTKIRDAAVVSFAVWEEGIVVAYGNPKNIRGVEDFARKDVLIVNREQGAGCRALLDKSLERLGMAPSKVRGYGSAAPGHLAAAWQVQSGAADCCIATRAAARAFGLGFIPLVSEHYDLVIHKRHLDLPAMQHLLDVLSRTAFRRDLEGLGGYDARGAGQLK